MGKHGSVAIVVPTFLCSASLRLKNDTFQKTCPFEMVICHRDTAKLAIPFTSQSLVECHMPGFRWSSLNTQAELVYRNLKEMTPGDHSIDTFLTKRQRSLTLSFTVHLLHSFFWSVQSVKYRDAPIIVGWYSVIGGLKKVQSKGLIKKHKARINNCLVLSLSSCFHLKRYFEKVLLCCYSLSFWDT